MITNDTFLLFEKFAPNNIPPDKFIKTAQSFLDTPKMKAKNVTIQQAVDKYKEYMNWHNTRYHDTEERYIPKAEKRINFLQFINRDIIFHVFEMKKTKLEQYLFGDFDIERVEKFVKSFEDKYNLK